MPKTICCKKTKCSSSSSSHEVNRCICKCVKECKEKYCKAKYKKLANKLLSTGLIQDSCTYARNTLANTLSGDKFSWLNNYLSNNTSGPVSYTDLAPSTYSNEASFVTNDPTKSNYVFCISWTEDDFNNPTQGVYNGIPLVHPILQFILPLGAASFGTSSFAQISAATEVYFPATYQYVQSYVAAIAGALGALPLNQVMLGEPNVPLFTLASVSFTDENGLTTTKTTKVGVVKNTYFVSGQEQSIYYVYGYGFNDC